MLDIWRTFVRSKAGVVGLIMILLIVAAGLFAPLLTPYSPIEPNLSEALLPPSAEHWFGTDDVGRDIFSGVVWGARTSMLIALATVVASTLIGLVVGMAAGYFGGWIDSVLSRMIEVFLSIPAFLFAILILAMLGASTTNIVIALTVTFWPISARLVRGEFIRLKERLFVEAARMVGVRPLAIMLREILPSALPVVVVNATFLMSQAILTEAGLSFLGLNDQNVASWGKMVFNSLTNVRYGWWTAVFPGLAIFIAVLGLNLASDGLNDALNPKVNLMHRARRRLPSWLSRKKAVPA